MSEIEAVTFRFPPGLREELASVARLAGRSMNAEVVWRLRSTLGERDGATASRGVGTADGAALSRSPSVVPLREGAAVGRTPPVAPSLNGACPHGRDPAVCETPACKEARRG